MTNDALKVLWVFSSFAADASGRRFAALISRLHESYTHRLCALDDDYGAEAHLSGMASTARAEIRRRSLGPFSLGPAWSYGRALKSEAPQLLVTVGAEALDWCAANRGATATPHIHIHDADGAGLLGADARSDALIRRRSAALAQKRVFVAGSASAAAALAGSWSLPKGSVKLLPWGVDTDVIRPSPRNPSGPVTLCALAPLTRSARADRLIRIAASLRERGRDARLRFVAAGPDQSVARRAVEAAGLSDVTSFDVIDPYDASAAAEALGAADIYADVGDGPASQALLAAAMASGLPVLGADRSDMAERVAPQNGLFVRDGDDESALAAAAELLSADPDLRRRIGAANRARASAEASLPQLKACFEGLAREALGATSTLYLPAPEAVTASSVRAPAPPALTSAEQRPLAIEDGRRPAAHRAAQGLRPSPGALADGIAGAVATEAVRRVAGARDVAAQRPTSAEAAKPAAPSPVDRTPDHPTTPLAAVSHADAEAVVDAASKPAPASAARGALETRTAPPKTAVSDAPRDPSKRARMDEVRKKRRSPEAERAAAKAAEKTSTTAVVDRSAAASRSAVSTMQAAVDPAHAAPTTSTASRVVSAPVVVPPPAAFAERDPTRDPTKRVLRASPGNFRARRLAAASDAAPSPNASESVREKAENQREKAMNNGGAPQADGAPVAAESTISAAQPQGKDPSKRRKRSEPVDLRKRRAAERRAAQEAAQEAEAQAEAARRATAESEARRRAASAPDASVILQTTRRGRELGRPEAPRAMTPENRGLSGYSDPSKRARRSGGKPAASRRRYKNDPAAACDARPTI